MPAEPHLVGQIIAETPLGVHLNENTPIAAVREERHGEVADTVESFIAEPADA